jgi:endonuclease-3 related protein
MGLDTKAFSTPFLSITTVASKDREILTAPTSLTVVFRLLLDRFGPQHWWPAESPWEVMVGAVLTQNTSWKNVELALQNLRQHDALGAEALGALTVEQLAELIRPAGYYRLKARRLHNLVHFLQSQYAGSLDAMFAGDVQDVRRRLLQTNGIGPETADSILLYAGHKPVFVVDAYTARITCRHGWIESQADYQQIQSFFVDQLPADTQLFNEFHALLVRVGKDYCHRTRPECLDCPLAGLLPADGPLRPPSDEPRCERYEV